MSSPLKSPLKPATVSYVGAATEINYTSVVRSGRWVLRATKTRQARGQIVTPQVLFTPKENKRPRTASPPVSTHSSIGENNPPQPASMANDRDDFRRTTGSQGKSSGGSQQSTKNAKLYEALLAWKNANEAREKFFQSCEVAAAAKQQYSMAACMDILKSMDVDENQQFKAMEKLASSHWRVAFIMMAPDMRLKWVAQL